jgi:hypothetical protein
VQAEEEMGGGLEVGAGVEVGSMNGVEVDGRNLLDIAAFPSLR